jgi:lysozyme
MASRAWTHVLAPLALGAGLSSVAFSGCAGNDSTCLDSTGAPLSTACAKSSTLVKGIDVSKWQSTISWSQVKSAGYEFAFIRASDGLNYPDGQFKANWQGAKAAGVIRGVYQFFRPGQDPIAQADLMLAKMQDAGWLESGDLPCVIDIEAADGQSNTTIRNKSLQWLQYVEQKTGKKPIVYTAAGWSSVLGTALSAYPLWIANYTGDPTNSCPLMPDGWQSWLFWQYTSHGGVPGVGSGDVDHNVWDGTLAQLKTYAQNGTVPPPPTPQDGGTTTDPCASAQSGNGPYCGVTIGGDTSSLYNCQNGATASKQVCANGCTVMPAGTADQCASGSSDPCAKAQSGNGHYCGKTLGGDPNLLYNCQNGATADTQTCQYGCLLNPPGVADTCEAAPPSPSGGGGAGGTTSSGGGSSSGGASGSGGSTPGSGGWSGGSGIDGSVGNGGSSPVGSGGC